MSLAASVARTAVRWGRVLPPEFAWWLGARLGRAFARLPTRERGRARAHLAIAFPGHAPQRIAGTVRRMFGHFGAMALWSLATLHREPRRLLRGMAVEGARPLRELWRAGHRGEATMIFTGHLGNWELLARVGHCLVPMSPVGRRLRDPQLDALVQGMRRHGDAAVIYADEGPRPVLRALRQGRAVSVLVDQDIPRLPGVFVPWFGRPARTSVGAAQLALATGTAVMPAFLVRRAGRWVVHFGPRRRWPAGPDKAADALALTAWVTAYEEALVRRQPEQWVWWHKRWRTRPEGEADVATPEPEGPSP